MCKDSQANTFGNKVQLLKPLFYFVILEVLTAITDLLCVVHAHVIALFALFVLLVHI